MSDTPRTDVEASNGTLCDQCVTADFARQLERELTDMTKRRDELLASLEKVVNYLTISLPASAE